MTAPAAISGDFATYKHIQGRKVLQLVIEVPAEMASAVFAALGTPGSGEGIPVALARLQASPAPVAKPEAQKERTPFSELPYSQQAALRCQEPDFRKFLAARFDVQYSGPVCRNMVPEDAAAEIVRRFCMVESRSGIVKGIKSGNKWEALEAEYYAWQRGMR